VIDAAILTPLRLLTCAPEPDRRVRGGPAEIASPARLRAPTPAASAQLCRARPR